MSFFNTSTSSTSSSSSAPETRSVGSVGSGSLSTGGKWGIGVFVSLLVIGGIVGGLVAAGVFSSNTNPEQGDDDPVPPVPPQPNSISEVLIGQSFTSAKDLRGSDGSIARIRNDILTITDQNGADVIINGVKEINMEASQLFVEYVTIANDLQVPFGQADLAPTGFTLENGRIIVVSGDVIVITLNYDSLAGSVGFVPTFETLTDLPDALIVNDIATYGGATIYEGNLGIGYCQSKVYEEYARPQGYVHETDNDCLTIITNPSDTESLPYDSDVVFPDLVGPSLPVGTSIGLTTTGINAIQTDNGVMYIVSAGGNQYQLQINGTTVNLGPFVLPLQVDANGFFDANGRVGPNVTSKWGIIAFFNGFQYSDPDFSDKFYNLNFVLQDVRISGFEANTADIYIGDQNPLTCYNDPDNTYIMPPADRNGSTLVYASDKFDWQCFARIESSDTILKPDDQLVFPTIYSYKNGLTDLTLLNNLSAVFATQTPDVFIRIGADGYFYRQTTVSAGSSDVWPDNRITTSMERTETKISDISFVYDSQETPATSLQFKSGLIAYKKALNNVVSVVAVRSFLDNVPSVYDGASKDIYLGMSQDCQTLASTENIEVAPNGISEQCYGSLSLADIAGDIIEPYPLVFPQFVTQLLLTDLTNFTTKNGLRYGSGDLDYMHVDLTGDLYNNQTLVMPSFIATVQALVASYTPPGTNISLKQVVASSTGVYVQDSRDLFIYYWNTGATSWIDFSDGSLDILLSEGAVQPFDCVTADNLNDVDNQTDEIRFKDGDCWFTIRDAVSTPVLFEESKQVFYDLQLDASQLIGMATFPLNNGIFDTTVLANSIVESTDGSFWYRFSGGYPLLWYPDGTLQRYQKTLQELVDGFNPADVNIRFLSDSIEIYLKNELEQSITPLATDINTLNPNISKTILFNLGTNVDQCQTNQVAGTIDSGIPPDDPNCWGELTVTPIPLTAEVPVFPKTTFNGFTSGNTMVPNDIAILQNGWTILIDEGIVYGYKADQQRVALAGTGSTSLATQFTFDRYPRLIIGGSAEIWPTELISSEYWNDTSSSSLEVDESTGTPFFKLVSSDGQDVISFQADGSLDILASPSGVQSGNIYFGQTTDSASCKNVVDNQLSANVTAEQYYWDATSEECFLARFQETSLLTSKQTPAMPKVFGTDITTYDLSVVWDNNTQLQQSGARTLVFDSNNGQILIYSGEALIISAVSYPFRDRPYKMKLTKTHGLRIINNAGTNVFVNKPTNNVNVRFLDVRSIPQGQVDEIVIATRNEINPDFVIQSVLTNQSDNTNGTYAVMNEETGNDIPETYLQPPVASASVCEDFAQNQGFDTWKYDGQDCFAGISTLDSTLQSQPAVFPTAVFLSLTDGQTMVQGDELQNADGSVVGLLQDNKFTVWNRNQSNLTWQKTWELDNVATVAFNDNNGAEFLDVNGNVVFPNPQLGTINYVPSAMVVDSTKFIPSVLTADESVIIDFADDSDLFTPAVVFRNGATPGPRINADESAITKTSVLLGSDVVLLAECKFLAENAGMETFTLYGKSKTCYGSVETDVQELDPTRVVFVDLQYTRVFGEYQLVINADRSTTPGGARLLDAQGITRWQSHANGNVEVAAIVDNQSGTRATIQLENSIGQIIWPLDKNDTTSFTDQPLNTGVLQVENEQFVARNRAGDPIITFPSQGAVPIYTSIQPADVKTLDNPIIAYPSNLLKSGPLDSNGNPTSSGVFYKGPLTSKDACEDTAQFNQFDAYWYTVTQGCFGMLTGAPETTLEFDTTGYSPTSSSNIVLVNEYLIHESVGYILKVEPGVQSPTLYIYQVLITSSGDILGDDFIINTRNPIFTINPMTLTDATPVTGANTGDMVLNVDDNRLEFVNLGSKTFPINQIRADKFTLDSEGDFVLLSPTGEPVWSVQGKGQYNFTDGTVYEVRGTYALASIVTARSYNMESLLQQLTQVVPGLTATIDIPTNTITWTLDRITIDLTRGVFKLMKLQFGFTSADTEIVTSSTSTITSLQATVSSEKLVYLGTPDFCDTEATNQGFDQFALNGQSCYGSYATPAIDTYYTSYPVFGQNPASTKHADEAQNVLTFQTGFTVVSADGNYSVTWSSTNASLSFFENISGKAVFRWEYTFAGESGDLQLFRNLLSVGGTKKTSINDQIDCDSNQTCETWYGTEFVVNEYGLTSDSGLWRLDQQGVHITPLLYDDFNLLHFQTSDNGPLGFQDDLKVPPDTVTKIVNNFNRADYQPFVMRKNDATDQYYSVYANLAIYEKDQIPFRFEVQGNNGTEVYNQKVKTYPAGKEFKWNASVNECKVAYPNDFVGSTVLADGTIACLARQFVPDTNDEPLTEVSF